MGSEPVPAFGPEDFPEPEYVQVNLLRLVNEFRNGLQQFVILWKAVFSDESYNEIEKCKNFSPEVFLLPTTAWAKILYELAVVHHKWKTNRKILIETMVPLYMARVASFVNQSREMDSKTGGNTGRRTGCYL